MDPFFTNLHVIKGHWADFGDWVEVKANHNKFDSSSISIRYFISLLIPLNHFGFLQNFQRLLKIQFVRAP